MNKQLSKAEQAVNLGWDVNEGLAGVLEIMQELWDELPETEPDLDPFLLLERLYEDFDAFYGPHGAKAPAIRLGDLKGSIEDSLVYHEQSLKASIKEKPAVEKWLFFEDVIEQFQDTYDGNIAVVRIEKDNEWISAEEIKADMRKEGLLE